MTVTQPDVDAHSNHLWLLGGFVRTLLRAAPTSVLDIGCGSGTLMSALIEHGVEVTGLDQASPRLDALREAGLSVRAGTAYELPFEDAAVDWVSMRHVPHHLEHPKVAFAEALRVARRGIVVAEPWFDTSLPSQRTALAYDIWSKRQNRRRGMFHAENFNLQALLAELPESAPGQFTFEADYYLRPSSPPLDVIEAEARELVSDLPATHADRNLLDGLLQEFRSQGLSWNGSMCVTIERPPLR